jgi:aspartate racemase
MTELVNGVFRPEVKAQMVEIAQSLRRLHDIEALILGGTELPLLLRDAHEVGMPMLDTTKLHVERALREIV